jgi:hypothetical protein
MSSAESRIQRDNRRREELNRQAREGRASTDPAERNKWLARDESSTRRFSSPDGGI